MSSADNDSMRETTVTDHYCTYFDHRYAVPGLAMLHSLRDQGAVGTLWVLCLTCEAEEIVRQLAPVDTKLVLLAELEAHFPDLRPCRSDRSLIEYYFTLTPHIVQYVFDSAPEAERVAYLDGDQFFFGPPAAVWYEAADAPVAIIPHNFQPAARHLEKYGTYNVGWVSFSRSEQGQACLDFWRESCRDWCYDLPDEGRFADQGYLDRFVEFAPDLAVIEHKGCNAGPWNVGRSEIHLKHGCVLIDADPLIFFHFTGFKKGLFGRWYNSHRLYRTANTTAIRDGIYRPYLAALSRIRPEVQERFAALPSTAPPSTGVPSLARKRGGGQRLNTALFGAASQVYRFIDWASGWSLREPGKRGR
jgi:hypothetical protein